MCIRDRYEASQIEGISAGDVALIGMAAGTIEYLTEKVGVDRLLKAVDMGNGVSKTMIKELLKQGGIEASEELTAEIANTIAERAILGKDSEYEQYVSELVAEGYSREQAEAKANKEFFWNRPIRAALSGFVAGGLSSGAVHVYNTVVTPDGRNTGTSNLSQNDMISQEANERFGEIGQQAYQAMWEQMTGKAGENMNQNLGSEEQIAAEAYQNRLRQKEGMNSEAGGASREQIATEAYRWLLEGRQKGKQSQLDPRMRQGIDQPGTAERNALSESQSVLDQQGGQENLRARRVPELSRNDVNIVLKGELTEAYLKKTGKSMEEFLGQVEAANEGLLAGRNGQERQRTLESLMADEVLRNVEAGDVKTGAGKRDYKYLEPKREASLSRKRLDRRMEAYERKEVEAPMAGDMQRQAPTQEVPEMQPMPNGPVRQENIDRGGEGRYDEIRGSDVGEQNKLNDIIRIEDSMPPGSSHPIKVYTDGNALINTGKIDIYIRGKVKLDVETTRRKVEQLEKISRENYEPKITQDIMMYRSKLHNYERSQEMSRTLNNAGIVDTMENNLMIADNLLKTAKSVKDGINQTVCYIEGTKGKVKIEAKWKILPNGKPYLATMILKPMKK